MTRLTKTGVTRCPVCGVHVEVIGRSAQCINKRCRVRRVPFQWAGDVMAETLVSATNRTGEGTAFPAVIVTPATVETIYWNAEHVAKAFNVPRESLLCESATSADSPVSSGKL